MFGVLGASVPPAGPSTSSLAPRGVGHASTADRERDSLSRSMGFVLRGFRGRWKAATLSTPGVPVYVDVEAKKPMSAAGGGISKVPTWPRIFGPLPTPFSKSQASPSDSSTDHVRMFDQVTRPEPWRTSRGRRRTWDERRGHSCTRWPRSIPNGRPADSKRCLRYKARRGRGVVAHRALHARS